MPDLLVCEECQGEGQVEGDTVYINLEGDRFFELLICISCNGIGFKKQEEIIGLA